MKINSVQNNNVNFTSIIPFKVMIDGKRCFEPKTMHTACNKLRHILVENPQQDRKKAQIINTFWYNDKDFCVGKVRNGTYKQAPGEFIKYHYSYDKFGGGPYIITGPQAAKLHEKGKNIGISKSESLEKLNTTDTFEVLESRQIYKNVINNMLRKRNNKLQDEHGNPLELVIHMISNGKYGKSTCKFGIDDIEFDYIT